MRLLALQEPHDGVQGLHHPSPLVDRLDAHHERVGRQCAGTAAEHGAAARHVVELHEAVRHHQRMVIRQAGDAGAEANVPRALDCRADEHLGGGDDLPAGGVVLADPGLVVAEVVEPLEEFHVARHGERRVLAHAVERRQEDAELQTPMRHRSNSLTCGKRTLTPPRCARRPSPAEREREGPARQRGRVRVR
jgi:hypothetical protein